MESRKWRNLAPGGEGPERFGVIRINLENCVQVRSSENLENLFVHSAKLQRPSGLPHDGMAPRKLADAVAIDRFDARQIKDESLCPLSGRDVNFVAEFRMAAGQGEPARCLDHDDFADLACSDLNSQ